MALIAWMNRRKVSPGKSVTDDSEPQPDGGFIMARRKQRPKRRLAVISALAAVGSGLVAAVVRRRKKTDADATDAGVDGDQDDGTNP